MTERKIYQFEGPAVQVPALEREKRNNPARAEAVDIAIEKAKNIPQPDPIVQNGNMTQVLGNREAAYVQGLRRELVQNPHKREIIEAEIARVTAGPPPGNKVERAVAGAKVQRAVKNTDLSE